MVNKNERGAKSSPTSIEECIKEEVKRRGEKEREEKKGRRKKGREKREEKKGCRKKGGEKRV